MGGLALHLVRTISPSRLQTLCGMDGIPLTPTQTFAVADGLSEHIGRRPGQVGGGIRAITSSNFGRQPHHIKHACKRCMTRYARGEG